MTKLVIAEPAARDLDEIFDYIARDNVKPAEKVFRSIVKTAERLARHPGIGRPGRLADTREFPVSSFPYVLVYEATPDAVTIVAVFHTSRDLRRALSERRAELKKPIRSPYKNRR